MGGFHDSLVLMDSKGVPLKTLVTFEGVFLLNNFHLSPNSLDVIADNRLVSFAMSTRPSSLLFAKNWLIQTDPLGEVELVNVSRPEDANSKTSDSRGPFQLSNMATDDPLAKSTLGESSRFVLENLGLVISTTLFDRDAVAILCRTDRTFRVLVFKLSQVDRLLAKQAKKAKKGVWGEPEKSVFSEDSDDEDVSGSRESKEVNLNQLISQYKGGQLKDVRQIFWLGSSFVAVYGKVVKLLDQNLMPQKSWGLEAEVQCLKEIVTTPGREVRILTKDVPLGTRQRDGRPPEFGAREELPDHGPQGRHPQNRLLPPDPSLFLRGLQFRVRGHGHGGFFEDAPPAPKGYCPQLRLTSRGQRPELFFQRKVDRPGSPAALRVQVVLVEPALV